MSIYICTICKQQKDSDFNCAEFAGKECCEECANRDLSDLINEISECEERMYTYARFFSGVVVIKSDLEDELFTWELSKETWGQQSEETQKEMYKLLWS